MLFEYFGSGINLGGYLSQYELIADANSENSLEKHFETFITEENIRQISEWGFDHVRIPMDGFLMYDFDGKCLKKKPLRFLEQCVEWCEKYKLNIIIDLHNFWGHEYGQMEVPTPLMYQPDIREEFCVFWGEMAKCFRKSRKIKVMFELFNEIADATGYRWNQLYKDAIQRIRREDPERWILVGSNYVNSVGYLDRLDLLEDQFVFYNFHYYEPNVFTHQKAYFSEEFLIYSHELTYPGNMNEYLCFLKTHPEYQKEHPLISEDMECNDFELMKKLMGDAQKFVQYSGKELYCGEFGVIDSASETEAVKWLRDFIRLCNGFRIGHAMWNYKCLDFGILDLDNHVVRPKILDLLKQMNSVMAYSDERVHQNTR